MAFNLNTIFSSIFERYKAKDLNALTIADYYDRLRSLALSVFEWGGLPESCSARYLEQSLFSYGNALFVNDPTLGFLTVKCNPSGAFNIYDEAVSYRAYGINYSEEFDRKECVYIRNNYLEKPTDITVMLFASRLAEAERTIDVNIKAQKTPRLIRGTDKILNTLKNIWLDYDGNEPVIVIGKQVDMDSFKVEDLTAPFVADKVQTYKREIWNECMTFLGINNNPNDQKKERMIVDEINANNDLININAQSMLLTRQEAAKQINKMFKNPDGSALNVTVRMRTWNREEESEDGEIHSGAEDDR